MIFVNGLVMRLIKLVNCFIARDLIIRALLGWGIGGVTAGVNFDRECAICFSMRTLRPKAFRLLRLDWRLTLT